jgi:hypothetical protein
VGSSMGQATMTLPHLTSPDPGFDTIVRATLEATVYDDQTCVGRIIQRGDTFEVFDVDRRLIGVFTSLRDATRPCRGAR